MEKDNATETLLNSSPLNEERFNEISKQMTMNKLCQLDNYCIFIASKYFESIDDHINLVHVCKRLRCNMEKFHFNPLPLTKKTRNYFSYLQTLFIYNIDDELFEDDDRIIARKNR